MLVKTLPKEPFTTLNREDESTRVLPQGRHVQAFQTHSGRSTCTTAVHWVKRAVFTPLATIRKKILYTYSWYLSLERVLLLRLLIKPTQRGLVFTLYAVSEVHAMTRVILCGIEVIYGMHRPLNS